MNFERIHHTLIYECKQDFNISKGFEPGYCYEDKNKMQNCQSIAFAWAYGGNNIDIYPKDMGYPIGGDTDYLYYIFEIHYDNPQMVLGYIESITWRYYMTKRLRPKELGIYTLGTDSSVFSIAIPPGVDRFPIKTYCFNDCIKDLNEENITVVSAIPHTHLVGVEVWTKIIRKGNDIGYLFFNRNYDFNYQTSYTLNPFVNITQHDELITQCVYKTVSKDKFVFGGSSTREEMCFHSLTYYPRKPNFKVCISLPYVEDYAALLVKLNQSGSAHVPNLGDHLEKFNAAVKQTFETIQTNDFVRRAFGEFYNMTRMNGFCGEQFTGPKNQTKSRNTYVEPNLCAVSDDSQ
ncbi:DBH-like monooxygenase 1, partial [Brachionus plicatilis]